MKTLLMMSLTGSLMALVVMATRALFGRRLHPRVTYALWLTAALCLLLPLRLESRVSVMNAPAAKTIERSVSMRMEQPVAYGLVTGGAAQNDVHMMEAPSRQDLESGQVQPEDGFSIDAWDVAGLIWAAGALVTAGYVVVVNMRFRGRVRRSRRPAEVPWVMGRRLRGTKVYVSRAVPSPCLVGLFRPYIVVTPQAMAEEERFFHVLVHELSHKRQCDPFWSMLRTAVLVAHWFNPIVWVAASLSRADCENACDALTIRELGEDRRVDYGKTLLSFLRARPTATGLVNTATTMAQSRRQIRRRISLIAKERKYRLAVAVLCVALVLTGCAVTMTNAPGEQAAQPSAPDRTPDAQSQQMSDVRRAAFEQAKHEALLQGGVWRYAESDVDGDGRVELLLLCDAETTAGQLLTVSDYDEQTGEWHEELSEYPLVTFYGNGMAEAGWSHSQGKAGDVLWPYNLYRYDAANDTYQQVAMVDAWEKQLSPEGFPEDVDAEGAGAVYYIMTGGEYDTSNPVSKSEYESWRSGMIGSAANLQVDYLPLTEDASLANGTRPGGQLGVYMDNYEAAIEQYASGFADMSEEEARAALPGLEDFVLYGRKNGAGDAYIVAVLREAPATQAVVRRDLYISWVSEGDEATTVLEQYGVTESGEQVLLRSYTVPGEIYMNNVETGSAQDNALIAVLPGSAAPLWQLSGELAQRQEAYARQLGGTTLADQVGYPYLTVPVLNDALKQQTGISESLYLKFAVDAAQVGQLAERLSGGAQQVQDWTAFYKERKVPTSIRLGLGPDDEWWLWAECLVHMGKEGYDAVCYDREAVEQVRALAREKSGTDPLAYAEQWYRNPPRLRSATLSFYDWMGRSMRTQTIADAESLNRLSEMVFFPDEVMTGGSACPFGSTLIIETDQGSIAFNVADDSCDAMCYEGSLYLDYQGRQEDLFALFPECEPGYGQEERPTTVEILPTGASAWKILDDAALTRELYDAVSEGVNIENERRGYDLGDKLYELDFRSEDTKRLELVEMYETGIVVDGIEYMDVGGALRDRVELALATGDAYVGE